MPDRSSNISFIIFYSAIGAESLRIARASDNPDLFSLKTKPLTTCMNSQWVSIYLVSQSQKF